MVARNYHRVPARKTAVYNRQETLNEIVKGVEIAGRLARVGYGNDGHTVLLQRHSDVIQTSTYIALKETHRVGNKFHDLGFAIARDVAEKMVSSVGCGAGTSVALLAEITRYAGLRDMASLREELDAYLANLPRESVSWETLETMAGETKIPDIAKEILRVWRDAGDYGVIAIREGHRIGVEIVEKEEAIFRVWPAENRLAEQHGKIIESAVVAVCGYPLINEADVIPLLELGSQWAPHPFVVFAPVIAGKALDVISLNRAKGVGEFYGFWTKSMRLTHIPVLEDLAAFSGARIIHPGYPLDHVDGEWLGTLRRIEIGGEWSLCAGYPEHGDSVEAQIRRLEFALEGDSDHQDKTRERISNLDGGFRILKIKGVTDNETKWLMSEAEKWTAKMVSCIRQGVIRDIRRVGLPSFISADFCRLVPEQTTDPYQMWYRAFELAMSGAEMIRSTGAVICEVR